MHDLTTIQGDEPVGQRPYQTLPEAKKKTRASASESSGMYLFFAPSKNNSPKAKVEEQKYTYPISKWKMPQRIPVHLNRVHESKVNLDS